MRKVPALVFVGPLARMVAHVKRRRRAYVLALRLGRRQRYISAYRQLQHERRNARYADTFVSIGMTTLLTAALLLLPGCAGPPSLGFHDADPLPAAVPVDTLATVAP